MAMGTVTAAETFDAERQGEFLRKAMRGIGTDERRIIQILVSHNNDQRQEIATKYKQMYGRSLVEDLESELSGCFEDAVLALLIPSIQYDAKNLHKALDWMTNEDMHAIEELLIETLCAKTNAEMAQIKDEFQKLYKKNAMKEVESELSGHLKNVIIAQMTGTREEDGEDIDEEKVKKDAQDLYDAGEGMLGTDESVFNKVLCMRSFPHLRRVFKEYKTVAGKDIEQSLKDEMSGDLLEAFLAIVSWTKNSDEYYAERLFKTMDGPGTDDAELIRLIVGRSEIDLVNIKEAYEKKYEKTLVSAVEDDTSGDYKRLLTAIINGNVSPP